MAEQLTSAVAVLHQQAVCAEVVDTLEEVVCAAAEYSLAAVAECAAAEEVASLVAECEAAEDSLEEEVASLAAEGDADKVPSLPSREEDKV